jgi:16S rRNA (guanine966-N2)-methyltransferase
MENRRPGRNNSPGRGPSSPDRSDRPSSARGQDDSRLEARGPRSNGGGRSRNAFGTRDANRPYGKPRRSAGRPDQRPGANGRSDAGLHRGRKRLHNPARPEEPQIKITSDDQVTDGKFRGHHLKNSVSPRTSHTDRKLREILFKIIARRVKGRRFLDLGAGCGMIGIEAISRGTMLSSFVERSPRMCGFVRKNLEELGVKNGHGEVEEIEIGPFLKRAAKTKRVWDLVFLGTRNVEDDSVFDYLKRGIPVARGGLLIIEHDGGAEFPEKFGNLGRWRVIANGAPSLTLYERK